MPKSQFWASTVFACPSQLKCAYFGSFCVSACFPTNQSSASVMLYSSQINILHQSNTVTTWQGELSTNELPTHCTMRAAMPIAYGLCYYVHRSSLRS